MKSTGEAIEKMELVEGFKKKKSAHSVHRVDIQTANDLIQSISENWVLRLGHIGITAVSAYLHVSHFYMYQLVLMTLASFRWQAENFRFTNPAELCLNCC